MQSYKSYEQHSIPGTIHECSARANNTHTLLNYAPDRHSRFFTFQTSKNLSYEIAPQLK